MPVTLPAAESTDLRPSPPNVIVWLLLLLVFTVAGVAITLLTWPHEKATGTVEFWIRLLGVAPFLWSVALGLRLVYFDQENDRLDAENEMLGEERDQALEFASEPLAVVAYSYLSAAGNEDVSSGVAKLKSVLEAKTSLDGTDAIRHSALQLVVSETSPSRYGACFERLIDSIGDAVKALPLEMPFGVRLIVPVDADQTALQQTWQTCWDEKKLRPAIARLVASTQDVMALDEWLDERGGAALEKFLLFVAVQLHESPPQNSAEAAVAMLIGWPPLASRHEIGYVAHLHRPVQGHEADFKAPMSTALEWGGVKGEAVNDLWQAALHKPDKGALSNAMSGLGVGVAQHEDLSGIHDLDVALGHAGCAAAWLAVALGIEHATQTRQPQLVTWRNGPLHFSVIQAIA